MGLVCFNHGRDSGPWGTKIRRLAEVAARRGFAVESVDYQGMLDPEARVARLLATLAAPARPLVLVGSSMGAYVAARASAQLRPDGLFLMAPAFYIDEYAEAAPQPHAREVAVAHGWHDEVVPVEHSLRYAQRYQVPLHVLPADHRLEAALPLLELLLDALLARVAEARP